MTRAELKANAITLGGALALIVLILGAQGLADRSSASRKRGSRTASGSQTPAYPPRIRLPWPRMTASACSASSTAAPRPGWRVKW